jgi:hypothetical protein
LLYSALLLRSTFSFVLFLHPVIPVPCHSYVYHECLS